MSQGMGPQPGFCRLQSELYFVMVFNIFKPCSILLGRFVLMFTHYSFLTVSAHMPSLCHTAPAALSPARGTAPWALRSDPPPCPCPSSPRGAEGSAPCPPCHCRDPNLAWRLAWSCMAVRWPVPRS